MRSNCCWFFSGCGRFFSLHFKFTIYHHFTSMLWNASALAMQRNHSCSISNNSFTYSGMHRIENKSVYCTARSTHKQTHSDSVCTKSVQKKIDNNKIIHRRNTTKQKRKRNEREKRQQIYRKKYIKMFIVCMSDLSHIVNGTHVSYGHTCRADYRHSHTHTHSHAWILR